MDRLPIRSALADADRRRVPRPRTRRGVRVTSPDEAYAAARVAHPTWAALALAERVAIIESFRALVDDRAEQLARYLTEDMGKPITQARGEVRAVLGRIDFFLEHVAG